MEFLSRVTFAESGICKGFLDVDNIGDYIADDDDETEDDAQPTPSTSTSSPPSQDIICIVCFVHKPNILFLPCRHLRICEICWVRIQQDAKKKHNNEQGEVSLELDDESSSASTFEAKCPYCNSPVKSSIEIFN